MSSKLPETHDSQSLSEQRQAKINFIRRSLGALPDKLSIYCSDPTIRRYLVARNWDVKKATKMLKEAVKWRRDYKPEEIRWEEIAKEAETGKIYRSDFVDKHGRSILVMRPGRQNTKSSRGQIRYLVYCMENAVLNLPSDQEQMVWLIDFQGFTMSNISIKVTKETAHVLQDYYPERLGTAILYNPPKFFEPFWQLTKPFLDPKTCAKVKFVYSDDVVSTKLMQDIFDIDKLECAFGGKNPAGFNIDVYAEKMREDDKRMPLLWTKQEDSALTELRARNATDLNEGYQETNILAPRPGDSILDSDGSVKDSTHGTSNNMSDSDTEGDDNGNHISPEEVDGKR